MHFSLENFDNFQQIFENIFSEKELNKLGREYGKKLEEVNFRELSDARLRGFFVFGGYIPAL